MNIQFVKVYPEKKVRETPWIIACPTCQFEREVGYPQIHNIVKGKSTGDCRRCAESKTKRDMSGLELGRKYNPKLEPRISGKSKRYGELISVFGIEVTDETRNKLAIAKKGLRGEQTNAWNGGLTDDRRTTDYKELRIKVFERDNYTCQHCLIRGGELHMDHIKEWCNYPDLRFEITNCRTLCASCHRLTDTYGRIRRKSE